MTSESEQVKIQASRVLEHIQTLNTCYGTFIATDAPELADALGAAAVALGRFVSESPKLEVNQN